MKFDDRYCSLIAFVVILGVLFLIGTFFGPSRISFAASEQKPFNWNQVPTFNMRGGLNAFWDIHGWGKQPVNINAAHARGFKPATLVTTFLDFEHSDTKNLYNAIGKSPANPWKKPVMYERVVRANLEKNKPLGILVHDIEFEFEEDARDAWANLITRRASGKISLNEFEEAYFRKWAEWFWLPLKWTREKYPEATIGLYGPQAFRRDYWGIAGKNAQQIDGTHRSDWRLWKYIDPYVDFYIASIYVLYDQPDSIFYMASNVEENYRRTRELSAKDLYAYTWLEFHSSNSHLAGKELPNYIVEAMAIVPYFSGAKGVVLFGLWKRQTPYQQLPKFAESLKRVAGLSKEIGRGKLVIDEKAHLLWNDREPLIRKINVTPEECVIMAINPWQSHREKTTTTELCGDRTVEVVMRGRHTTILHTDANVTTEH